MKLPHNDLAIQLDNNHDRLFIYIDQKMFVITTDKTNLILNVENGFELKQSPLLTSITKQDDKTGLILDTVKKTKRLITK